MKIIRTYEILGLLADLTVIIRRKKFGRYGSINNVLKNIGKLTCCLTGLIRYDMSYQSLGDGCIHAIHGHMISIVCRPAESKLGKVSRADHDTALLICYIHKDLGSLPRL